MRPVTRGALVLAICAACAFLAISVQTGAAGPLCTVGACEQREVATQTAPAAQQLAQKYSPIVYTKQQDGPCDRDGEAYYPTAVELVLGNPDVALIDADGNVAVQGPTAADLYDKPDGFYLDFPGDPKRPACDYEEYFKAHAADSPPTVYAHVLNDPDTNRIVVQYWLYFYFNDWNNNHESDWEFIQLAFDATSVDEALSEDPVETVYAQHGGGERSGWNDSKLRKEDGRPVIYTPRGSHGSLYGPSIALGKGEPGTGFGCDDASPPSDRFEPETRLVPNQVSGPDDPFAWITYEGRWGQKESGEFNGPTGPNTKKPWSHPLEWQNEQRDSSVTVPEESIGPNAAGVFCSVVAKGSVILFGGGPYVVLGLGIAVVSSMAITARRTRFRPVTTTPLRRPRRFGQILRAALKIERSNALLFLGIGALFVPLAGLLAPLQFFIFEHAPAEPILETIDSSPVAGIFALALGGLAFGVAYWLVISATIAALRELEAGDQPTVFEAYALMRHNLRTLFRARIRSLAIVTGLAVTVVGIPWALRQGVRWLFLEHAVLLAGTDARGAREHSERLVAGDWWRTLGVTVAVAFGAIAAGPIVAMGVLLFSGASLSLVNLISSIIYVALIPFAAIALTLLYFDLLAAKDGA